MEIVGILFIVALAWLWLDSLKAREVALKAAREACLAEGHMLLDWTVSIAGLRIARDEDGRVRLQRAYDFEYSDTGDNRLKGGVVLLGHRVVMMRTGVRTLH